MATTITRSKSKSKVKTDTKSHLSACVDELGDLQVASERLQALLAKKTQTQDEEIARLQAEKKEILEKQTKIVAGLASNHDRMNSLIVDLNQLVDAEDHAPDSAVSVRGRDYEISLSVKTKKREISDIRKVKEYLDAFDASQGVEPGTTFFAKCKFNLGDLGDLRKSEEESVTVTTYPKDRTVKGIKKI